MKSTTRTTMIACLLATCMGWMACEDEAPVEVGIEEPPVELHDEIVTPSWRAPTDGQNPTDEPPIVIEPDSRGVAVGPQGKRHRLVGEASWYGGKRWQGRKTACGERFDQNALTAAHNSLPLGTKVRVTNPETGEEIVVRITDRGSFRKRVIDLSREAANQLGFLRKGLQDVELAVLAWGDGSC